MTHTEATECQLCLSIAICSAFDNGAADDTQAEEWAAIYISEGVSSRCSRHSDDD